MFRDLVAIVLIAIIVVASFVRGDPFFSLLALFIIFVAAVFVREKHERARVDFINQLKSSRKELRSGGTVVVDNELIRYNTVLTTYWLNVGGLVANISIPSPFLATAGHDHSHGIFYSLVSLVSGWWAFPEGPIITINYLRQNLSGGNQITVAMLIDGALIRRSFEQEYARKQSAAEQAAHDKLSKPDAVKQPKKVAHPSTGIDSASQKLLDRPTSAAHERSLEERLVEFENRDRRTAAAIEALFRKAATGGQIRAMKYQKKTHKKHPLRKHLKIKKFFKNFPKNVSKNHDASSLD